MHVPLEQRPEVLLRVAVPARLPRRPQVLARVVRRVHQLVHPGDVVEEPLSERRLELGPQPARPPGVHDPHVVGLVVEPVAVAVDPVRTRTHPRAQLRHPRS